VKLFSKYNRINIISTVIIFLLGCVAFSFLLRYVIISQVDEDLKIEQNEIATFTEHNHHLPGIVEVRDQYTAYEKIPVQQLTHPEIHTRNAYDSVADEKELQRTIRFNIKSGNDWYKVTVSKSLEGIDDLIQTIIIITISIILSILASTFVINRIVLKRLWKPFYKTLETTHSFSIDNYEKIFFQSTNIDEFNYLNTTLTEAFSKAQQDYQTLKEFTENAAHELQTPVAVIQSKLDVLIQNDRVAETESENIQSIYKTLQGLARLNQSLLLLAKIENKQFNEKSVFNLKDLLESKLDQFSDLWKDLNIALAVNASNKTVIANYYLAEVLISNLLSNATKHNIKNGLINIALEKNLQVTNTGTQKELDKAMLFKRFSKQNNNSENNGLGLSIAYQVCQASGFTIDYTYQPPNLHIFIVDL
jgi:signal transduction histidine kinase